MRIYGTTCFQGFGFYKILETPPKSKIRTRVTVLLESFYLIESYASARKATT